MEKLLVIVGLTSVLAAPALAAERMETGDGMHHQGTWEVTLTSDLTSFSPSVGYYVVDNLAATVATSFDQTDLDRSGVEVEVTRLGLGVGLEYNIPTGTTVVPFVGVAVTYENVEAESGGVSAEETSTDFHVSGGAKFMVGQRGSVNAGVEYVAGTLEETGFPDIDASGFGLFLGYSVYFR